MADLISREAMLEALGHFNDYVNGDPHFLNGIETAKEITENLPAVDAVPVVHGLWIERMYKTGDITSISYFCSECDCEHYFGRANYCPNCGAKMDGERRDEDALSGR